MDTRDLYKLVRTFEEEDDNIISLHDSFDIELSEGFVIETGVVGFTDDGVIVHLDEDAMEFLDFNGVLLESSDLEETYTSEESPVYNAVLNRITRQHLDLLGKYGPAAVMAAVEDVAHHVGKVEEIGSSDVSIWTREAIEYLEAGHYKHLHEGEESVNIAQELADIVKSEDPFELVYRYIAGDGGEEMRKVLQDMYDEVVIDNQGRLHPDDDFETIINTIIDQLEKEHSSDHHLDELAAIKKLAHGYEAVDEGLGTKLLLAGAALIAALVGVSKYEAQQVMKNDPQLAKLAHYREIAQQRGDEEKVKELDRRIKLTYDHNTMTDSPVRGDDGQPIDPVYEAEYQGRKVPLGKPMQGDVKKSKVYVKKPNGKVVKVNFGDKNMRIKKNSPGHRKSFRARHHCENPGPRWKARYWSCRAW